MIAVHHLMFLDLWSLEGGAWFSKCHGPSEPFQWPLWVNISTAFGPCLRESPSAQCLRKGHTTLPDWACVLPLAHSSLCIASASSILPVFFHLPRHWWSGGVQPRCFPQAIRRLLFQVSSQSRCSPPAPLPSPHNCWNLSLSQRAYGVAAVCLIRRGWTGTRESHTDDCLAGELLGACVCVFLLPLFLLQLWADVLYWLSGCPFSGPWYQCFIPFPCLRPFTACPTLASFLACIHLSLLHPELCSLSLGSLLEK